MKLHLIIFMILVTSLLSSAASLRAQNVTIEAKDVPMYKIFKQIEKQTGFLFWYKGRMLGKNTLITVNIKNLPLKAALDKIFDDIPFTYEIVEETIVVKEKPAVKNNVKEKQSKQKVTGIVTDENGQPLAGVSIKLKGTAIIVSSDNKGAFNIEVPDQEAVLQFSYVGYETYEVTVTENVRLLIKLKESPNQLQGIEVVSTGYQTLPKERATGSFVQIDNELLNRRVSTNILDRLEGVVPGLLFNKNTSSSINGPDINIRGRSTLFANDQPLIVVDGFPYDGDISNINPNEIKSISILKDAAAASIWGVRSGNGVIVLTTKKGNIGSKLSVDFNANITVGDKPDVFYNPNYISSSDQISLEKFLFGKQFYDADFNDPAKVISPVVQALYRNKNGLLQAVSLNQMLDSLSALDIRNDISKYYYRKSLSQQYSSSLSGGGNNYSYRFSLGYDQNDFSLVGNSNKRTTISLANTFNPLKNLEFQSSIYLVNVNSNNNNTLSDLNVAGSRNSIYPYVSLRDKEGNSTNIEKGYNSSFIKSASASGKYQNWEYYPLNELDNADNTSSNLDNRIVLSLKYKILSGFDLSVNYQYEKQISENNAYFNQKTYYTRNLYNMYLDTVSKNTPIPVGGILNNQVTNLSSNRIRTLLGYNNTVGRYGTLTALLGSEISNIRTTGKSNTSYGYDKSVGSIINTDFRNYYPTAPLGTSLLIPNINGFSGLTDRFISYFGNAAYVWNYRYILSASGRIDRSNLFGVKTNKKSVPLYSAGIAWDISKEDFYKSSWVPYLKLRATYGYNGNIDKTTAAVTTIQQSNNSYYSGYPFARILNPNNPQLQWEKTKIINFGLDFSLKSDLISGSIEYYKKEGIQLIGFSPLPGSSGLAQFKGNTANSKGNGTDIQLNIKPIKSNTFSWIAVINYSHILDKVSKYEMQSIADSYLTTDAGYIAPIKDKPIFSLFAYKWAGLDNKGNPQGYVNGQPSTDYNKIINNATVDSLVFVGSARPTAYGSFINTFSYKSFSLSFNVMYKFGYYFRRSSINYGSLFYNWKGHSDFNNRWQNTGDESRTNIPSMPDLPYNANRDNFYQSAEVLVSKGDHIRLQDINLSYKIPVEKAFGNIIKSAYFYFYANNIGILWRANDNNLDPDTYGNSLPEPKSYSFGVKCSF